MKKMYNFKYIIHNATQATKCINEKLKFLRSDIISIYIIFYLMVNGYLHFREIVHSDIFLLFSISF